MSNSLRDADPRTRGQVYRDGPGVPVEEVPAPAGRRLTTDVFVLGGLSVKAESSGVTHEPSGNEVPRTADTDPPGSVRDLSGGSFPFRY